MFRRRMAILFAGGICRLAGIAGLTACFILKLEKPMLIVDAVTAALLLAGGVAYATQPKGVNCDNGKRVGGTRSNKDINGGIHKGQHGCRPLLF